MLFDKLFKVGQRAQIVLPQINMEAGAGDEYPHMGIVTIAVPMKKKKVLVVAPFVCPEAPKPLKPRAKKETKPKKLAKKEAENPQEFVFVEEPDLRTQQALWHDGLIFVRLDKPFLRKRSPESRWIFREEVKKKEWVQEMPVPHCLLQFLKPEDDPLAKKQG